MRHYGCVAGVQVTASHNPKEYNGYKVYWDNGAQIIPPHDVGIATQIEAQLVPWAGSWSTDIVSRSSLVSDPLTAVEESYYRDIQLHCLRCGNTIIIWSLYRLIVTKICSSLKDLSNEI